MMKCITLTILLLLASAGMAAAQDIPLSQILVEGEGWKEVAKGSTPPIILGTTSWGYYAIRDNQLTATSVKYGVVKLTLPEALSSPSGLALWPDQGTLVVGDAKGKHLWAFRVEKDSTLTAAEPYYALRLRPGEKESHVTALTVDDKGRLYAGTPLGVQVFDPTGRLCGVISKPGDGDMTGSIVLGEDGILLVSCGGKVYSRKIQGKGVAPPK